MAAMGLFICREAAQPGESGVADRKVTAMREKLAGALRGQFEREMERGRQRIAEGIAPYSRFVRSEHEELAAARTTLETIQRAIETLRERIEVPALG